MTARALKRVVVLDHGSGNLRSAERALARAGAEVSVTADLAAAADCAGLVVPGVGAFGAVMEALTGIGGHTTIATRLADERPVLGICVGMQVLFDEGLEHGERTTGLGHLKGGVTLLEAPVVPHMGWNTVNVPDGSRMFAGVEDERFYFVHSYAARDVPNALVTTSEHGERFAAAVEQGVLSATQFHPEKSGDAGAHLLENWVRSL